MVRPAVWALPLVILQLDHQGGREKPERQETWMGPRQLPAASPQSFYITIM